MRGVTFVQGKTRYYAAAHGDTPLASTPKGQSSGSPVLDALDAHRDAHAAADAKRGEALLGVAALHFVEQGGQDARARGSDGVADGDGAAVHVHLLKIPAQGLVHGAGLGCEGFVGLDQVQAVLGPPALRARGSRPGSGQCP